MRLLLCIVTTVISVIVIVRSGILVMALIAIVIIEMILILIEVRMGMEVVLIIGERRELVIWERRIEKSRTHLRWIISWEASQIHIRRVEHGWLNKHGWVERVHHRVAVRHKSTFIIFAVVIKFITFILSLHDGSSLKETDIAASVFEEFFSPLLKLLEPSVKSID